MSEAKLTPMMEHYNRVKAENPDCILFYRVGDFFELFKEDAVKAAAILNIQLTTRGSSTKMAGVPAHALEPYVQKLVNSGERVALVDQLETPEEARARGGQGTMIERGLVRIYTAATITEDELISAAANNFLASVERADGKSVAYQIALVDISTLEIELMAPTADLYSAIAIKNPAEILIDTEILNDPALADFVANFKERLVVRPSLGLEIADGNLQKYFGAVVGDHFTSLEKQAIAKAISYIEMTQIGAAPKFRFPTRTGGNGTMEIDAFSMSNLEVLRAATPNGKSLFDVIDFTKTAKGKRLLASRLQTPLTDPAAINARLDDVAQFAGNAKLAKDTLDILAQTSDLERIMARVEFGRANARDLLAAQASILFAPTLQDLLRDTKYKLSAPLEVAKKIRGAVINPAESENKSSEIIKEGYSAELDNLRRLSTDTKKVIAELQARYAAETGINTLRIKYVGTTGYSVEVPNQKASVLMENKLFSHRQSLVNAVRFTTAELMELDAKIASAGEKANALERELFTALVGELKSESETIATYAATLAELDVSAGLGLAAAKNNWTRPMVDTSLAFDISAGRHPVVEDALKSRQNQFIPNSAKIEGSEKIWLLTGPNMAGKSTFLRQNAIIAIMAQIGSFVPAASAHIGAITKLFSRVGASDNLAQGLSTFMVEMKETAAILNQADERSFVILDEIGRGTATFDGLAIAYAVLEHIDKAICCRTLFATHYHELTDVAGEFAHVAPYTVEVKEHGGDIIFMHKITKGAGQSSYGIHVAKIAGVPARVVGRAKEILGKLESTGSLVPRDLFSCPVKMPVQIEEPEAITRLKSLDLDALSPRDALERLYELKKLA